MDIVDRLRRYAGGMCVSTPPEMDAADEIERLRAEIKAAAFCDARCSWVEHHPSCVFSERDALRAELALLRAHLRHHIRMYRVDDQEPDPEAKADRIMQGLLGAAPKPGEPT